MDRIPLYGCIPYIGGEYSVIFKEEKGKNSYITCNLPDNIRPHEANSRYTGTLETYLKALRDLGITVWEPMP